MANKKKSWLWLALAPIDENTQINMKPIISYPT
jgi:hypothetical protein